MLTKESLENGRNSIKYWLYTPEEPKDNMPIIVYLHGGSGKGDDLEKLMQNEGFPQYVRDGRLNARAYIAMPQASEYIRGWDEMNDEILFLIENLVSRFKIDRKNVSLTGHSMGGMGAWMLGCHNRNVFARIAPLSGTVGRRMSHFADRVTLPVWSFVGTEFSDARAFDSNIGFFTELKKYNSAATLTVLKGYEHREVVRAYLEYDIIGWLMGKDNSKG